jgi:hypothetical protein
LFHSMNPNRVVFNFLADYSQLGILSADSAE